MTTGEYHPLAENHWVTHDPVRLRSRELIISASDHMVSVWIQHELVVWNWRTGAKLIVSTISP